MTVVGGGKHTAETRFYLSSLLPEERSAPHWHNLIRGHWAGVEIRNHWRRDALWGEDRSRTRKPSALANLALIRSALLERLGEQHPGASLPPLMETFAKDPAAAFHLLNGL